MQTRLGGIIILIMLSSLIILIPAVLLTCNLQKHLSVITTPSRSFKQVCISEQQIVSERRSVIDEEGKLPQLGIALSGGGIRSAAFSLGFLHTLTATSVLNQCSATIFDCVDWVSSVSGGGYTASGLCSFLQPDAPKVTPKGAVEALYDRVVKDPSYLGGYTLGESPGAKKMLLAILLKVLMMLAELTTACLVIGILVSRVCNCGLSNENRCPEKASLWACPSFTFSSNFTVSPLTDSCPSSDAVHERADDLFRMTRSFVWWMTIGVVSSAVFAAILLRIGYALPDFSGLTSKLLNFTLFLAFLCGLTFSLVFYWDLVVALTFASFLFNPYVFWIFPLFGMFLFLICTGLTQSSYFVVGAVAGVLGFVSLFFIVTSLPATFAALITCVWSQETSYLLVFIFGLFALLFPVLDRFAVGSLVHNVYRYSLKALFFRDGQEVQWKERESFERSEYRRIEPESAPIFLFNACVHGSGQGHDHFLLSRDFCGSGDRYFPTTMASDSTMSLAMALSAAAVTPRLGRATVSLFPRLLLTSLGVNMGNWFSVSGRIPAGWTLLSILLFEFLPRATLISIFLAYNLSDVGTILVLLFCFLYFIVGFLPVPDEESLSDSSKLLLALVVQWRTLVQSARMTPTFRSLKHLLNLSPLPREEVFLSDGGHHENLGIYSLVLRGVPIILCSDAAQDTNNDDLFSAICLLQDLGFKFEVVHLSPRSSEANAFWKCRQCRQYNLDSAKSCLTDGCDGGVEDPPIVAKGIRECLPEVFQTLRYWNPSDPQASQRQGYILILKLHLSDPSLLVPPLLSSYFSHQSQPFSIDATSDQFFDSKKFRAYFELAQFTCERHLVPELHALLKISDLQLQRVPRFNTLADNNELRDSDEDLEMNH